MKTTKLFSALVATAFVLSINTASAMEQDTGYPWFGDLPEKDRPTASMTGKVVVKPVEPSEKDTGYPWYADMKDDLKAIQKPVTIFKSHQNTSGNDFYYPWLEVPRDHQKQDDSVIR